MKYIPKTIQRAIEELSKLPGIGSKTAERLVFHLLKKPEIELQNLGHSILRLKEGLMYCQVCQNLATEAVCEICKSDQRHKESICIVEDAMDLIALEKAGSYKGLYHVLHGIISPIDGIGPEELTITELLERTKKSEIKELIFALNPSMEGEATAAYITRHLEPNKFKITRIARGIPVGGHLEYADSQTLKRAMEGRMEY